MRVSRRHFFFGSLLAGAVPAAIAFRAPGKLDWDSANLRFTNSAEANKYVKPVFRKGWEMKL